MLKWKLENGKTVLVFPKRKIQFVGRIQMEEANEMHEQISTILCDLFDSENVVISLPKLNTMTVTWTFPRTFNFLNSHCNATFSYEPELFPAAIISNWKPIKVILFPSGHVNFTGIKHPSDVVSIIKEIDQSFI